MKYTLRHICFLGVSCMMPLYSFAADSLATKTPIHREFDPEKIEAYRRNLSYQYGIRNDFSFTDWLVKLLNRLMPSMPENLGISNSLGPMAELIVWALAIVAVIAIVFIIFRGKWSWAFRGKKFKKKNEEYSVFEEDIHSINFTDEIEQAVQSKNYRKATRLFYLKSLKLLSDSNNIDWKINKTNTDYRREIKNKDMRGEFDFLSTTFEYVWYGEFEPTEETFMEAFKKFRNFNNRFQTTATA